MLLQVAKLHSQLTRTRELWLWRRGVRPYDWNEIRPNGQCWIRCNKATDRYACVRRLVQASASKEADTIGVILGSDWKDDWREPKWLELLWSVPNAWQGLCGKSVEGGEGVRDYFLAIEYRSPWRGQLRCYVKQPFKHEPVITSSQVDQEKDNQQG